MKAIRTTPCIGIDQCSLQVVFAKKPRKRPHRGVRPVVIIVRASRGEARRNCGSYFERLLVECFGRLTNFAEALGANRPEASRRGGLQRHEPTERLKTGLDIRRRMSCQ